MWSHCMLQERKQILKKSDFTFINVYIVSGPQKREVWERNFTNFETAPCTGLGERQTACLCKTAQLTAAAESPQAGLGVPELHGEHPLQNSFQGISQCEAPRLSRAAEASPGTGWSVGDGVCWQNKAVRLRESWVRGKGWFYRKPAM